MKRVRRVAFAVLAIVTVTAVAAIWMAMSATAGNPGLTLLINNATRSEITPGTPLLFRVSLGSGPTDAPLRIGSPWQPWHRLIRLERIGSDQTLPLRPAPDGEPRTLEITRDSEGRPSARTDANRPVVTLDRGRLVHTAFFAATPDETSHLTPGEYRIRAVFETTIWQFWPWCWRGRSASPAATLVVRGIKAPNWAALEVNRLSEVAAYHLSRGAFVDAQQAADELVRVEPKRASGYILRGDALAGVSKHAEALAVYRRALQLLPRSYETPDLLLARIDALMSSHRDNRRR